ncbi:MAG: hypothetical protein E7613_09515 [Ruminococcaceae bacterium]|nr:hypothetical protein [Oscillospiraceae bacterium]
MNLFIDLCIVAIVAITCIWGYRSGFVVMLVNLLKNIVSLIVAAILASKLGAFLYQIIFKGIFENITMNKIATWLGVDPSAEMDIGPLIEKKHSGFVDYIENMGFDLEDIASKYADTDGTIGDFMLEYIARPLGITVSNVVAFIIIFIIAKIVIRIVGFIIGKLVQLPVLNITNHLLGGILGLVLGIVFAFVFIALLNAVIPYVKIGGAYLTVGDLEEGTILYKYLVQRTPIGLMSEFLTNVGVKK